MKFPDPHSKDELREIFQELLTNPKIRYADTDRYIWIQLPTKLSRILRENATDYMNIVEVIEEFLDAHFVQEIFVTLHANEKVLMFRKHFYLKDEA